MSGIIKEVVKGQDTSANSAPVVVASDQSDIGVRKRNVINNFDIIESAYDSFLRYAQKSSSITSNGGASNAISYGLSQTIYSITGTFVATLKFQGTLDGANWVDINFIDSSGNKQTTLSTPQLCYVNSAGFLWTRILCTAFTSGTVAVLWSATEGQQIQQLGQKTSDNSLPVVIASDQTINVIVNTSSAKQTYHASVSALVIPAAATDVFTISGSASKTIKILKILISGTTSAGSGISASLSIVKRSTLNTAGTSTTITSVPNDSTNSAATAVVKAYTANPTLGTAVGNLITERVTINTAGAISSNDSYGFGDRNDQPIVLRGVNQSLCINFGGVTITNPLISISIEFTEE